MSRVLITGGAGFIGTNLARRFLEEGHEVLVLDSLSPQVHGADPERTSPLLRSIGSDAKIKVGTVTSKADLRSALNGIEIVVHLAAETGTGQSMYEIDRYVDVNVGGTAKLLDILVNESTEVKRILVAASRAVYGEGAYRAEDGELVYPQSRSDDDLARGDFEVHIKGRGRLVPVATPESALLHPTSVYGITKQVQESLVMTSAPTAGIEPVSLRYQNVYGPGQSLQNPYTGILSIFSNLIRDGRPINVFEDGLESRDFVYIDDVVEATYRAAVTPEAANHIFNVGSGSATSVIQVVDALMSGFGREVPVEVSGNYRLGDIRHNLADISMAQAIIGYQPKTPLRLGLRSFIDWVNEQPISLSGYERSLSELSERSLLK